MTCVPQLFWDFDVAFYLWTYLPQMSHFHQLEINERTNVEVLFLLKENLWRAPGPHWTVWTVWTAWTVWTVWTPRTL